MPRSKVNKLEFIRICNEATSLSEVAAACGVHYSSAYLRYKRFVAAGVIIKPLIDDERKIDAEKLNEAMKEEQ